MEITPALIAAALACLLTLSTRADLRPRTLDKPLFVQATLVETSEKVSGSLVRFDADAIYLKLAKGERTVKWSQLTPPSQYGLRAQLIDKKSAADWLELAELGMQSGLRDQARTAVASATRLDPASKLKGDAILRATPNVNSGGSTTRGSSQSTTKTDPGALVKFQRSTPDEDAKAIQAAQKVASGVGGKLKVSFAEIQTPHFIIFTDWDPREYDFLKTNCEAAYAAVSNQFEIPVTENIFVGKLPIFMFANQNDFSRYAQTVDSFPVPATVAGYFASHGDGSGHMVMWKPDTRQTRLPEAERRWAYTLTHEFTHAFISRYRTNVNIPRWLNEGLAEVIASSQFPRAEAYPFARMMATRDFDFEALFNDEKMPGGEMYPVMQTMVEALIRENRKGFLDMFNDIKDGMEPEAAMKKHFKAGYKDWEPAWRNYAKRL